MMDASELSGRALDAAVAEEVFGYSEIHPKLMTGYPPGYDGEKKKAGWPPRLGPHPLYSTDIAAAWQVVEKCLELDKHLFVGPNDAGNMWVCEYGKYSYEVRESAPEAICRAALKVCK